MATEVTRTLAELAQHVGGQLEGDGAVRVRGVNGLKEATPADVSFYSSTKYRQLLGTTRAAAVLVGAEAPARPEGRAYIRVGNPYLAYARISQLFHPPRRFPPGVQSGAFVDAEADVDAQATVMAGACVQRGARVGPGAVLFPGAFVGEGASVGAGTVLHPNVTVREHCVVGQRCIVHASAVIGADGFGFALDMEKPEHVKIPQVGIVRVEDDVEIGAGTCIDRATTGETVIGRGAKLDNLVQIAHNVKVGPLSLICAQAGVSGSATLGQGVLLAGQVGVVGHITVGDLVKVGAQSGVAHDVPAGTVLSGSPAIPHRDWLRATVAYAQLPELLREVRQLRARVASLEAKKEEK